MRASGEISCWGDGGNGQLGDGFTISSPPVTVMDLSGASDVSAGLDYSCAVAGGTVSCWGVGLQANSSTPVAVSALSNVRSVGTGDDHRCALLDDSTTPVTVTGIDDAVSVSVGTVHTCAVLESGGVACWGDNHDGRLGPGAGTDLVSLTPVSLPGIEDAVAVGTGYPGQLGDGRPAPETPRPVKWPSE